MLVAVINPLFPFSFVVFDAQSSGPSAKSKLEDVLFFLRHRCQSNRFKVNVIVLHQINQRFAGGILFRQTTVGVFNPGIHDILLSYPLLYD